jgi:hypothetical protein
VQGLLGGIQVYDANFARAFIGRSGLSIPPEFSAVNKLMVPLGEAPARGWFLMTRDGVNSLDQNALMDLELTDDLGNTVTFYNLVFVTARNLFPGAVGATNALFLVEVADLRWLCQNPFWCMTANAMYNVPNRALGVFYSDTLNAGTPWTWDELAENLWDLMPDQLGTYPGLPVDPDGVPESWVFAGVSAWRALCKVLWRIGCAVSADLTSASAPYSIVQIGAADSTLSGLLSTLDAAGRTIGDEEVQQQYLGRAPYGVQVFFRTLIPGLIDNITDSVYSVQVVGPYTSDTEPGTYHPLWDDLVAVFDDTGTLTNGADLSTRATSRMNTFFDELIGAGGDFARFTFSGVAPVYAGSISRAVAWSQAAKPPAAWTTEVINYPYRILYADNFGRWLECSMGSDGNPIVPLFPADTEALFTYADTAAGSDDGVFQFAYVAVEYEDYLWCALVTAPPNTYAFAPPGGVTFTGTTDATTTVSDLSSVAGLAPGMLVLGADIPAGAYIVSIDVEALTLELSDTALDSTDDETLSAYFTIYVAKPVDLQQTPWDGLTVPVNGGTTYNYTSLGVRSATTMSGVTTESITIAYFVGDTLLCDTGIDTNLLDPNSNPITLVDVNNSARVFLAASSSGAALQLAAVITEYEDYLLCIVVSSFAATYGDPPPGGVTFTADTNSSTSLTSVSSDAGLSVGMILIGDGIPAGTTIAMLSGGTITMSADATATTSGVTINAYFFMYVAKPYDLQQTPWDGQTVPDVNGEDTTYTYTGLGARTATPAAGSPVDQEITPSYFLYDILTIYDVDTGLTDPDDDPITVGDVNTSARIWIGAGEAQPAGYAVSYTAMPSGPNDLFDGSVNVNPWELLGVAYSASTSGNLFGLAVDYGSAPLQPYFVVQIGTCLTFDGSGVIQIICNTGAGISCGGSGLQVNVDSPLDFDVSGNIQMDWTAITGWDGSANQALMNLLGYVQWVTVEACE